MKYNIFSIIYLFIRTIPVIIVFYFIYQYFIFYDYNTIYFLLGLLGTFIITGFISNTTIINKYKNVDIDKIIPNYCNVFLLTKNGPLSIIPLSQTMFSYAFCFIFYIIYKYRIIKENIQYLVLFPLFIIIDFIWNTSNNCINSSFILLAIIIGGVCGLLSAYIIDKKENIDLSTFLGMNKKEEKCIFNPSTNKFICYGSPDTYEDVMNFIKSTPAAYTQVGSNGSGN